MTEIPTALLAVMGALAVTDLLFRLAERVARKKGRCDE